MRRIAMIVALGALVGLFGGVVTASPALARGPKWTFLDFGKHFTEPAVLCGFKIRGTQLVDKAYIKTLNTMDGSTTFLLTGSARIALTNPANGKTITQNVSGPVKLIVNATAPPSCGRRESGHSASGQPIRSASGCLACSSSRAR
jgi:hypothetical protein